MVQSGSIASALGLEHFSWAIEQKDAESAEEKTPSSTRLYH